MNDGLAVLVALLLLSAMLCVILTIAGRTLGRVRHATTWAIAFGLATAQWAANIAYVLAGGGTGLFMLVDGLSVVVAALLAIGFRQRSGAPERRMGVAIAGAAIIALIFVMTAIVPHVGIARAAPLLFRALVLAMAAAAVTPPGRSANPAERSMIGMLWLFVLFNIAVAAVALASGVASGRFGNLDRWMLLMGLPAAFAGTGLFAVFLLAADLAERMRLLAARDPLTGILNRRGFEEEAIRVIANAVRHRQPLSLALADLDRFKTVNDAHGHAVGDMVLRRFAADVSEAVRLGDLFARIGGEEFVLLLVNTPGEAAVAVVDRLRQEVATRSFGTEPPLTATPKLVVTVLEPGDTLESLLSRADEALYRSKLAGRDRVTFAGREVQAARG
jgi:diguanylate cyclase (GGDEF)-like protein